MKKQTKNTPSGVLTSPAAVVSGFTLGLDLCDRSHYRFDARPHPSLPLEKGTALARLRVLDDHSANRVAGFFPAHC